MYKFNNVLSLLYHLLGYTFIYTHDHDDQKKVSVQVVVLGEAFVSPRQVLFPWILFIGLMGTFT